MLVNGGARFSTFLFLRVSPCASLCVQKRRTHTDASGCVAVCVLLCVEGNGSTCSVGFDATVFGSGSITHKKYTLKRTWAVAQAVRVARATRTHTRGSMQMPPTWRRRVSKKKRGRKNVQKIHY